MDDKNVPSKIISTHCALGSSHSSLFEQQSLVQSSKCILGAIDNGHVTRVFFKNTPNNWPIWADGPNKLWGISR